MCTQSKVEREKKTQQTAQRAIDLFDVQSVPSTIRHTVIRHTHTAHNHIFMLIDFVIDEGDTLIRSRTLRIQTTLMFTTHQYTEFLG